MRVSSRDDESQRDSQSQIAEMKEGEAVSALCTELADLLSYSLTDKDARLHSRGDEELEITLQLPSLPFKFRLDKASPRLTARVLGDLLLKPLLGVTNAMITAGVTKLEEHAHVSGRCSCFALAVLINTNRQSTKLPRRLRRLKESCIPLCIASVRLLAALQSPLGLQSHRSAIDRSKSQRIARRKQGHHVRSRRRKKQRPRTQM